MIAQVLKRREYVGPESITAITISGVPSGATLSAGTNNGNGTWTLTPAQLTNLTITPSANSDADFTLSVTATSSESGTTATSAVASLSVTVNGVADTPVVSVAAATGNEDSAIPLNITAALTDTDGSENLRSITISGIPAGATLTTGNDPEHLGFNLGGSATDGQALPLSLLKEGVPYSPTQFIVTLPDGSRFEYRNDGSPTTSPNPSLRLYRVTDPQGASVQITTQDAARGERVAAEYNQAQTRRIAIQDRKSTRLNSSHT